MVALIQVALEMRDGFVLPSLGDELAGGWAHVMAPRGARDVVAVGGRWTPRHGPARS